MTKKRYYFDYAATTPVDRKVEKAMQPYFGEQFGNPSNLYELGRIARAAIRDAGKKIADFLNCAESEFIFTGSATESDNLAIAGVARANKDFGNKIIISGVEHKGILAVADALKKEGFVIAVLPVGNDGLVDLDVLKKELDEKTILVSVTMSDSETGTIQPISEIASLIRSHNLSTSQLKNFKTFFHSDASQAAAYLSLDVKKLGVDLLTLSAHKMGGPKGIGGLYVRRGVKINPIIYGGGQQGRLRSGTENVPGIVGFGEAVQLNKKDRKKEFNRVKKLRDKLELGIFRKISKVVLNGHKTKRLPNFLNVSILDVEGEALLLHLDEYGIMINTGSACNSESLEPSYVLTALGNPYEFVHGSIRFTLGRGNTDREIDYVLKNLPVIVKKLRDISPLDLSLNQKAKMSDPRAFVGNQTPHFLRKGKVRE